MSRFVLGITRQRFYYGWLIVAVAFLAYFVGAGLASGAVFGVLLKPMSQELGWSRAMMVGAATLSGLLAGFVSPFVGRIIDRYGARLVMVTGAALAGAILLALSRTNLLWQLYLLYGFLGAFARAGLADIVPTTAVANWFVRRRGRAIAFTMMGFSLGTAIWVPVGQYVVSNQGWRVAWVVMGLTVWALIVLPAWLIIRRRPEDVGLTLDGHPQTHEDTTTIQPPQLRLPRINPKPEEVWTAREAMRTRAFWLILVMVVLTAMADVGIITHMVPYLTDLGFSPAVAASATSTFAITALVVKVFWGFLAERLHVRYCAILCTLGCTLAVFALMWARSIGTLYGSVVFYGLTVGGILTLQALVWPDYYGRLFVGSIRGLATVLQSAGAASGPLFAAWAFDVTGNYQLAFSVFAGAFLTAAFTMMLARPPQSPLPAPASAARGPS